MKIFIPLSARRGRSRLASAVTSNHVSGCRTDPTSRRTWLAKGSSGLGWLCCTLRMTGSPGLYRTAVVGMFYWQELRHTWACAPECTLGLGWIGTLLIPQEH